MSCIPNIQPYDMPMHEELSPNIPNWTIDPKRAVLLIHDMQEFFVQKIPVSSPRKILLDKIDIIRERCIRAGIPIAFTAQKGDMTEKERGLLKDFWGSGMKAEAQEKKIVNQWKPIADDWTFAKWRYSAFYKSNLLTKIREAGRDQLIICGVYAHLGVLITAVEAFSNDIETFLVADAIADFSREQHLMALNYAASSCAVNIFSDEVLS